MSDLDNLPLDKIGIVMREVERTNHYDIWYDDLGPNMIRLQSHIKFEPGDWVENIDGQLQLLEPAPIPVERIKRSGEKNLFKLTTKVLKPEDDYFESDNIAPGVQKYKKYAGLSTDFKIIFLNKKISEQMQPGVLYDVEICNFALLQKHEERDLKILKVMKALGTLWLAGNVEKGQTLSIADLNADSWKVAREDLMTAHAYTLKAHREVPYEQSISASTNVTSQQNPDIMQSADISLVSLNVSDRIESSHNWQREANMRSVFSDPDLIRSLNRIINNQMVRNAILRVDGAQLEVIDDYLRNPAKMSTTSNHSTSTDWIHCNSCFKLPANMGQIFFSSCGHVLCGKCGFNQELNSPISLCPVCRVQTKVVPVDKNMNPDIKIYFKNPHEIATHCMQQLKKVLDFQSSNRHRLSKYQQERTMRIQKFAENSGNHIKKMQEAAKKLQIEKETLLIETRACKQQYNALSQRYKQIEARLREKEKQLSGLNRQQLVPVRGSSDSGVESLNSLNDDFVFNNSGFLTSTPIQGTSPMEPKSHSATHKRAAPDIFQSGGNLSPIVGLNSSMFDKKSRSGTHSHAGADYMFSDRMPSF